MNKGLLIILFFSVSVQLFPQGIAPEITFHQVFDNREYFSDYNFPQTIFGARLHGAVRFETDSVHSFSAGVNYLYEHGSTILAIEPQAILFYRYNTPHLKMALGSFPRSGRLDLSPAFLNDTLNYYRPNVEGAWISYSKGPGEVSGFADWTGRVSENTRETFLAGVDAKMSLRSIFLQGSFLMYHNARSYHPNDSIPLQDNGILSVLLGYSNEGEGAPLVFSTSGGFISSYNRFRPADYHWSGGLIYNIDLRYTIFGVKGVYYNGTPISFSYGDPFYRAGNYGRLDLFTDPFNHPNIESKIGWNFHFVPGEGIFHSQQILISVTF